MSPDTNQPDLRTPEYQAGFWKGIVVGLAVIFAGLVIIAALTFFAMDRCPMCGRMMQGQNGVMDMNDRPQDKAPAEAG